MPEEGQENRAKGRVLEIEKMTISREKVTRTQGGKNETPDSEKSSFVARDLHSGHTAPKGCRAAP